MSCCMFLARVFPNDVISGDVIILSAKILIVQEEIDNLSVVPYSSNYFTLLLRISLN